MEGELILANTNTITVTHLPQCYMAYGILMRTAMKCIYKFPPYAFCGWRGGATRKEFGLAISRSRVQILLEATLRNNLRQVVYTYVPLSPSSITWYRPKSGDALRLGR